MIKLKNPEIFRRSIDALSTFISEGNFRFNDKGMSFKAIDPSQILLVDFLLETKAFDEFKIEPVLAGLDLQELNKVASRIMPNDSLTIGLTDSEMLITMDGETTRNFSLPLIDLTVEEPPSPQIDFDAQVEVPAHILKEVFKDASLFGNAITLRIKGKDFIVESRGNQGRLKTIVKNAKIKAKEDLSVRFSLPFLNNMIKASDSNETISLNLKSDSAILLAYKIGPAEVKYFLAPLAI
jgi:proliferating cell nuclear antigen